MKNPNNTRKLSFDLPGGEKAWFVLDLTYHSTLPEGMAESDLADLILAPLPVPCTRLTGSILLTPNGFSCHSYCEHYTFRWTADFHHKILLLDLLTVVKDQRGKGIGFHLFSHLVEWYGRYSFHHIRLSAEGGWIMNEPYRWNRLPDAGIRQTPEQNGYYTWGRFGFEMYSPDDIKKYQSWNKYFRCQEKNFPQLLLTENDRKKWKRLGFAWGGKFYLAPDSINQICWEHYRQSRIVSK